MLITIIIILAIIAIIITLALPRLYHAKQDDKLLELSAVTTRHLHDYCDSLEAENRRLVAENRNFILRIDELESRVRAMKARQRLGLRAYDVGKGGVYVRYVESVN